MKKAVGKKRVILAIDIGGSHVKVMTNQKQIKRECVSGSRLSPKAMVATVKSFTKDWSFNAVSIGYPGTVVHNRILTEPHNLGKGWVGFSFQKAFKYPTIVVNDALMQAVGSYKGGRMLFLGLGTGLGSAMIVDGILEPMELAHLPYRKGKTYEHFVGEAGLKRNGKAHWRRQVKDVIKQLIAALEPDYVVLGGGNADKVGRLPKHVFLGGNENAFKGGFLLWEKGLTKRALSAT